MKPAMKKFTITHIVLCEVATYRTVFAENFDEAMQKAAAIETVTATYNDGDHEIIADLEIKKLSITEVK